LSFCSRATDILARKEAAACQFAGLPLDFLSSAFGGHLPSSSGEADLPLEEGVPRNAPL